MKNTRRDFLKKTFAMSLVGLSLLKTAWAAVAWSQADFAATKFDAALKQFLKGKPFAESNQIVLTIPEIAENGAVVPVSVSSTLPGINSIALFAELNPVPLTIQMFVTEEVEPELSTRLKLAETSFVHALVETDQGWFSAKKLVKVTIGGCGG